MHFDGKRLRIEHITAVANVADLLDRRFALLMETPCSHGLPSNLSAWPAGPPSLTLPTSAFSRSTECHKQHKVSMGTIATRDAAWLRLALWRRLDLSMALATTFMRREVELPDPSGLNRPA